MAISIDAAGRNVRHVRGTNIAVAAPWVLSGAELKRAGKAILGHAAVKGALGKNRSRLLSLEPLIDLDKGPPVAKPTRFRATIYDYDKNRALVVHTPQGRIRKMMVSSLRTQPLPSSEEWHDALAILRADKDLGGLLKAGKVAPYAVMPPLSEREGPLGEIERALHVGLRPVNDPGFRNTIFAVNLIRRVVERYADRAPPTALATDSLCGAPDSVDFSSPPRGTPGSMWISWPAANPVWRFLVVRPAASSGTRGSGVEILYADYNGRRVLYQGHVPILNVLYDGDACGPYRDWQWQEHNFVANGIDVAPGFRWCTSRPQTIIDTGSDAGNFNGVAIYERGDSLLLVSEMQAGWYRYISEWTFNQAGWILPRFKFAATSNSCVCNVHNHHCYWRFDFDIDGAADDCIDEYNSATGWRQISNEIKRYRDQAASRRWRVRNAASDSSYEIVPGANDGTALGDAYARGDTWFLRYRGSSEYDDRYDSTGGSGTPANLDAFVNGESIDRQDVVVWYAGHFRHALGDGDAGMDHIVGPTLMPPCIAQVAGAGTLTGEDFEVLRTFRDRELTLYPAGKRYVERLREHTDELLAMLLADEGIKNTMAALAKSVVQVVRGSTGNVPPPVPLELVDDAARLLDLVNAKGSAPLNATIASARNDLTHFRSGSFRDALENMAGPREIKRRSSRARGRRPRR